MNNPLVSIIIPIYNVEQFLDECIRSIIYQTYQNIEIILIDDGCLDKCPDIADQWQKSDPRICVIHQKNMGLSGARNSGLEICKGDFIVFVDSDDWIEKNFVETLLAYAIEKEADIVACGFVKDFGEKKSIRSRTGMYEGTTEGALRMLYDQQKYPVVSWAKIYRKKIWKDLRFPIGRNYEDTYTTYRTLDIAKKVILIPEYLYHYRIRNNSIMQSKFNLKHLYGNDAWKQNYLFCKKNYPQIAKYAKIYWLENTASVLREFPDKLSEEEKAAKINLRNILIENLWYSIWHMPFKNLYYYLRTLIGF